MRIVNNNVVDNGFGIEFTRTAHAEITISSRRVANNNVYANVGGEWINALAEIGTYVSNNENGTPTDLAMNVSVDPGFVDDLDYHLRSDSLLIKAGTPTDAPKLDFDGDTRVSPPSIGFDEGVSPNISGDSRP